MFFEDRRGDNEDVYFYVVFDGVIDFFVELERFLGFFVLGGGGNCYFYFVFKLLVWGLSGILE